MGNAVEAPTEVEGEGGGGGRKKKAEMEQGKGKVSHRPKRTKDGRKRKDEPGGEREIRCMEERCSVTILVTTIKSSR